MIDADTATIRAYDRIAKRANRPRSEVIRLALQQFLATARPAPIHESRATEAGATLRTP
jgi:hypothetical protein